MLLLLLYVLLLLMKRVLFKLPENSEGEGPSTLSRYIEAKYLRSGIEYRVKTFKESLSDENMFIKPIWHL